MVAGLDVLVILKVEIPLAQDGRGAGDQGCPLLLNVGVITLEKNWVQIPVSDQTVFNDLTVCGNKVNLGIKSSKLHG